MIRVRKDFENPPAHLDSETCRRHLESALREQHAHKAADGCYKSAAIKKELEDNIYHHKCAYCESVGGAGSPLRIDHYRPCKGDRCQTTPSADQHTGYYWLAYEWSNLVLTCETCNRTKSTRFPIGAPAKRVTAPTLHENGQFDRGCCRIDRAPLADEDPLLLNPELHDPTPHLLFFPDGQVRGATPRGKVSVEKYGLHRQSLCIARKTLVDELVRKIRRVARDFIEGRASKGEFHRALDREFEELCRGLLPKMPFSRLSWMIYRRFDVFVLRQLPHKLGEMVGVRFESFKARVVRR